MVHDVYQNQNFLVLVFFATFTDFHGRKNLYPLGYLLPKQVQSRLIKTSFCYSTSKIQHCNITSSWIYALHENFDRGEIINWKRNVTKNSYGSYWRSVFCEHLDFWSSCIQLFQISNLKGSFQISRNILYTLLF